MAYSDAATAGRTKDCITSLRSIGDTKICGLFSAALGFGQGLYYFWPVLSKGNPLGTTKDESLRRYPVTGQPLVKWMQEELPYPSYVRLFRLLTL